MASISTPLAQTRTSRVAKLYIVLVSLRAMCRFLFDIGHFHLTMHIQFLVNSSLFDIVDQDLKLRSGSHATVFLVFLKRRHFV
jgi:hypothetical protein